MRVLVLTLVLIPALLFVPPVFAAPTCQTRNGDTIKCGVAGAMPVGWAAPDEERRRLPGPTGEDLWTAFGMLALLFSLIALMPKFDGSRDDDWDVPAGRHED